MKTKSNIHRNSARYNIPKKFLVVRLFLSITITLNVFLYGLNSISYSTEFLYQEIQKFINNTLLFSLDTFFSILFLIHFIVLFSFSKYLSFFIPDRSLNFLTQQKIDPFKKLYSALIIVLILNIGLITFFFNFLYWIIRGSKSVLIPL